MALLPDRFIDQVAQATDIVEVVGQFVALTKRGKEFVGVCPFHDDHRPSMYVSPAKQIFKCFACGAGGGVYQFVMGYQKLSFPEAVRHLAQQAGIPVPVEEGPRQQDSSLTSEALVKLTTFAAKFFGDQLNSSAGADALAYARSRRLTDESIERFGLGYAPDSWEALRSTAIGAGYTDRQLQAAGLAASREDGSSYDRFRNRLMFPIFDASGRIIAFGGRAMSSEDRAKYLNSPETSLFDKSANLYGLNWSRQAIVDGSSAIVVEGYLDALMLMQEGVANVVATLGTALTARHVRTLSRLAEEVVLVFDADVAGQAAAERATELFLTQRLNVRVAAVPQIASDAGEVKDPCDYVLAAGADAFRELVAQAPDALQHAWSRRRVQYEQATTLPAKRQVVEDFLSLVVSSAAYGAIDPVRQGLLAGRVAEMVGVSQREITEQMRLLSRRLRRSSAGPQPAEAAPGPSGAAQADRAESWLLAAVINEPAVFEEINPIITPEAFADPLLRAVAEQVWALAGEGRLELGALVSAGQSTQWGRIVTDLHHAGEQRGNHQANAASAAEAMQRRQEDAAIQNIKYKGDTPPEELLRKVQQQARKVDKRRLPRQG